jgi:hypothetical protein
VTRAKNIQNTFIAIWLGVGLASHIFWWSKFTDGKWDGPAIPLCALTALQAAAFGPLIFPFDGWLYWLTGPHDRNR